MQNPPITTKLADFFRVDLLYSARTSRFLLFTVTFSSTERSFIPPARSVWPLAALEAAGLDLNPTRY